LLDFGLVAQVEPGQKSVEDRFFPIGTIESHDDDLAASGASLRLDDALWARIKLLDRSARRLVEAVAVAASPTPQAVVADAAGIGEAEMFRLSGRLRTERLVRTSGPSLKHTIESYHDRVREAVLAKTPHHELRTWHERLAEAMLASESPEPERLAYHLEHAGRVKARRPTIESLPAGRGCVGRCC
jgi:hypothetical protein